MKPARLIRTTLTAALIVGSCSTFAIAAGGGEEHGHDTVGAVLTKTQGFWTAITTIVVFALTSAFLGLFVWPKISKGLADRENKIKDAIESAELAQEQAKAALQEYERSLAQARTEAQKMLDDAKAQQQAMATESKARNDAELAQMRDRARRDIESAKAAAVMDINKHATDLATAMASKILKREVATGDQQRLIQESLQELQAAGRN